MDLRPEEKLIRLSELSENPALKPFAHFCVQPAAPGLTKKNIFIKYLCLSEKYKDKLS